MLVPPSLPLSGKLSTHIQGYFQKWENTLYLSAASLASYVNMSKKKETSTWHACRLLTMQKYSVFVFPPNFLNVFKKKFLVFLFYSKEKENLHAWSGLRFVNVNLTYFYNTTADDLACSGKQPAPVVAYSCVQWIITRIRLLPMTHFDPLFEP